MFLLCQILLKALKEIGLKNLDNSFLLQKGSAGEVKAQLYVTLDLEYITKVEFEKLNGLVIDTSRMMSGFINYLKDCELKSAKFN